MGAGRRSRRLREETDPPAERPGGAPAVRGAQVRARVAALEAALAGEEAQVAEAAAELAAREAQAARTRVQLVEAKRQLALDEALAAGVARETWRYWAGGLPLELLAKVTRKVVASEARGPGSTLMAITCKGWRDTLKQDAISRAGGPGVWRDWGNRFGEGLPVKVLAKIAEKHVAQTEAAWAAELKKGGWTVAQIKKKMAKRKRKGNCLFVFARVCKPWRKAQLKVGGRLRTRVMSDVAMPGSVALVKWALGEGCPRDDGHEGFPFTMVDAAADYAHRELVQWLCGEGGFAMDERVMAHAAEGGSLDAVQWLRAEGCTWDTMTCYHAVHQGHVEVLRWARENGCPWDAETRDRAAEELGYTDDFGNVFG